MDLFGLGSPGTSGYMPDPDSHSGLIEEYKSLIWTERYQTPGEFELKTSLVMDTMERLPEGQLISIRESREVMMVETHDVAVDDNGYPELTVKGRSLTAFLEHRHVKAKYGKRRKMLKQYSPTGAALVLIWQAVDNTSGYDVTREGDFAWSTKDAIPNVIVSDSVTGDLGDGRRWWLEGGPLYPQLENILIRGELGFRTIRPEIASATKVWITSGLSDRGAINRVSETIIQQLCFDLYRGLDRSHTQSVNDRVEFKFLQDHIYGANYLWSIKDYKTACQIMSGKGGDMVYRPDTTDESLEGLFRRVMTFDAGEPEEPDKPTDPGKNATEAENNQYEEDLAEWQNEVDIITDEFLEDAEKDALRALKQQRKVFYFDGDISPLAPYVYKRDYDLGDTISLWGDYNLVQKMVVSEYIRVQDAEGEHSYPGLILP